MRDDACPSLHHRLYSCPTVRRMDCAIASTTDSQPGRTGALFLLHQALAGVMTLGQLQIALIETDVLWFLAGMRVPVKDP